MKLIGTDCKWLLFLLTAFTYSCKSDISFGVVREQPLDTNRLVKVTLAGNFDEPMEIAVLPDRRVLIIERKGSVKLYDPQKGVKLITRLPVYTGQEDGLLGVALDPAFSKNNWVFFYYSPVGTKAIQRVSRFTFTKDSLDLLSEKVLIEIPTQRQECCHSAGSLAFGPGENLFIAVGDNTNPHNPGYYNSIDERKGKENWDAQRTAGNANDLRGKILRIHPEPDGTYTIPAGNLFPKGTVGTKPEIFAMGCRNPYRIAVDQKKGWLYWGDVGQNTVDDPTRGPVSYDEWHLAKEPGFFGWPYFAGPNAPYTDFDFATGVNGPFYDSAKPVNNSINNTGIRNLPPAKGALIWYSYDESKLFPHLGTGGKSPIAGPVFYTELYKENINDTTRHLHEYYNNKVFIAEWMRDWINIVSVSDDGKVDSIEPFMKSTKFNHPIDLEIGPDGVLYVLEYGTNWFAKNKDAALSRIEYIRGDNRVTDTTSTRIANTDPDITFKVTNGNKTFYWPGVPIQYEIEVKDKEDGSLSAGQVSAEDIRASLSYTEMGSDITLVVQAHEKATATEVNLPLIANSDCKACHSLRTKSVGPDYFSIAKKYPKNPQNISKLAAKIIKGGSGVWGEHAMSAHPQLSNEDATQMVEYILSLDDEASISRQVPLKGKIEPKNEAIKDGMYLLTVSYNDKPVPGTTSNEARQIFYIRPATLLAAFNGGEKGVAANGSEYVSFNEQDSWIVFNQLDLTSVKSITLHIATDVPANINIKKDSYEGQAIGSVEVPGRGIFTNVRVPIEPTEGIHDVYIVCNKQPVPSAKNKDGNTRLKSATFNRD